MLYITRRRFSNISAQNVQFHPTTESSYQEINGIMPPENSELQNDDPPLRFFVSSHLFRLACVQLNLFHFGAEMDPARWNQVAIGDNNVNTGLKRFRQLADAHGFLPLVAIWPRFYDDRIADVHFVPEHADGTDQGKRNEPGSSAKEAKSEGRSQRCAEGSALH